MSENNSDSVVAVFCGAGGLSLGFEQAGIAPVVAADIDADACETYQKNFSGNVFNVDLANPTRAFNDKLFAHRDAFALIGGPPCQGFSTAGARNDSDPRNKLIFQYLHIVSELRPRWFLFENVEGILTSNGGRSISSLVKEFIALGYKIRLEKINFAAFGLPQARKRVVIIGNRLGIDFCLPKSTHSFNAGKHKSVNGLCVAPSFEDALAGLGKAASRPNKELNYSSDEPINSYDALMRQGNATGRISLHYATVSESIGEALAKLSPGQTMKDLPPEFWHESFKKRAFRRVMDGTPTEKRGGAPSGIKRLQGTLNSLTITSAATREFIHPSEDRPLTLREAARLQSFPDVFQFAGGSSSIAQQIGNAFPPLASKILAEHLKIIDGSFGADVRNYHQMDMQGELIGYKLTDSYGKSPALQKTEILLEGLMPSKGPSIFKQDNRVLEAI